MSFSKEVWTKLSDIDVTDYTEKKGNLSYLSWAWAYGVMMKNYPELDYAFEQDRCEATETVEGTCIVNLYRGEEKMARVMWLPVMDYKNKAIPNPDKFAINKAKMRCLTKCFSLFGLGHYIYAGEDLPESSGTPAEPTVINGQQLTDLEALMIASGTDEARFLTHFEIEKLHYMPSSSFDLAQAMLTKKLELNEIKLSDDQLAVVGKEIAGQ